MSALPDGDPAPDDGALPASALARVGERPFAAYVHVPFCSVRCGYCDFNTYTATDLGPGADRENYDETVAREIALARRVLGRAGPLDTVFFGGGTPTLLAPGQLTRMLEALEAAFGLTSGAEVSVEANPDTVDASYFARLAAEGITRVSIGMQSADPSVLATLERTHDPARVARAVEAARAACLEVSVDLIYGTPGESASSWDRSVRTALELGPDHVSCYALGIEEGTKLGAQVRRGEVPDVDPDVQAERYEHADALLHAAGYAWYEVSNWARPGAACRHNLHYWRGDDWWGFGPGAHSHVAGVRWWNVKHPRAYAARLAAGHSPAAGREVLSAEALAEEKAMLGVRLAEGMDLPGGAPAGTLEMLVADGLIDGALAERGRIRLTLRGRLLADRVTYAILGI